MNQFKLRLFPLILMLLSTSFLSAQKELTLKKAETAIDQALQLAQQEEVNEDSLILFLNTARSAYMESEVYATYATTAAEVAQSLYRARFSSIGVQWLKSVDADISAVKGKDYEGCIALAYQLARGYYFSANFDQCLEAASENLKKIDSTSADYADHLNLIGVVYRQQGKLLQSANTLEKVLTIREQLYGAQHNSVASVLNNLGVTYRNLGLYNEAADIYHQALEIRKEILGPDHPDIASLYLNMGVLYLGKLEFGTSIEYLNQALNIYQLDSKLYQDKILAVYNNLAIVYRHKGAHQEAEAYYRKALNEYENLSGDYNEYIGDIYVNWSNIYSDHQQYDRALDLLQESLKNYHKVLQPDHPKITVAANNLGRTYFEAEDYEAANQVLTDLYQLIEDNSEQKVRMANLNNDLADVYFRKGDLQNAFMHNQKALELQKELFNSESYRLAYSYNKLAEIASAKGQTEEALTYIQQAMASNHANYEANSSAKIPPSAQGFIKYDYFVESLMLFAQLSAKKGDAKSLLQAKMYFDIADSVLVQMRDELVSWEDKITLSQQIFEVSEATIENQIQLVAATGDTRYWEAAFERSEKSKNNILAQSIQANQARRFFGMPDSLIHLEDRFQSDINYYKLVLLEEPDSLEEALFQEKLFEAQRSYRGLVKQMEEDYPYYFQLKYDRSVPRISAIQYAMPEKTALISYFTGSANLYCFVITKNDFQVYQSPIDDDFFDQQVGFRKSITYLDDLFYEDYCNLARSLQKTLFPFTLDPDIESLVIVPDGNLSKLPFEALLTKDVQQKSTPDFSALPYLIKEHNVHYELSATMYYQEKSLQSALETSGTGLMAFAPVFAEPQELDLFKTETRDPLPTDLDVENGRDVTLDGKYVKALPGTAEEVQSIVKMFQEKGETVSAYLFQEASEKQLKSSALKKQQYIHIATHGFINEKQPDLSGLMFYPNSSDSEDHILYSGEVYGLNLNADLVVLSACETGLGQVARGEGLLGLSRAFRYAGADHLIVSLWKVEDKATANLMAGFYKDLLEAESPHFTQPLHRSKLDMIASKTYSHPYYWSAFVLIGSK